MFKKKIKVCLLNRICTPQQNGNWIDLRVADNIKLEGKNKYYQLPLGIKTQMPKWYKAEVKPRSSTFKNYGLLQTNSPAEIEYNYKDEWLYPCISFKPLELKVGERICQIQFKLREDAPWYAKIQNLFYSTKIVFVNEKEISGNRGGLGSTGKN